MNARLAKLLDHLAATLTPEREAEIEDLHRRALSWEPVERLPLVISYPAPSDRWVPYPHAEALADPEKMLFNELVSAWGTSICHRAEVGDDLPCTIRANFGCVLIASLFGARIEQVEDNPPWARSFQSRAEFVAALQRDPLDFTQGWCPRVLERYEFYRATLTAYPALNRVIKLVLPDLQGPMDTVELLRGCDLYLDLLQDSALVADALSKAAAAQIGFARHLARYVNDGPHGWAHQHGFLIRGPILIRIDSAIMLSPRMYREQIAPHDARVLRELGGGGLHSCGNVNLNGVEYLNVPKLQCLDLGQPEMNDLDKLYIQARERRVPLLRVTVQEGELTSGSVLRRFPTGVSLLHPAKSLADARRIMSAYLGAAP
ncbi:MAG TPA: hypothetical protein P5205_12700 [Candidatus Paceibacterota bacterium]|nr:hypothetical protein [Verrucomicrobiota bacterium]HSA11219.1 hypothetical protein [Candidatus Paceibacterota bacterium]